MLKLLLTFYFMKLRKTLNCPLLTSHSHAFKRILSRLICCFVVSDRDEISWAPLTKICQLSIASSAPGARYQHDGLIPHHVIICYILIYYTAVITILINCKNSLVFYYIYYPYYIFLASKTYYYIILRETFVVVGD